MSLAPLQMVLRVSAKDYCLDQIGSREPYSTLDLSESERGFVKRNVQAPKVCSMIQPAVTNLGGFGAQCWTRCGVQGVCKPIKIIALNRKNSIAPMRLSAPVNCELNYQEV